MNLSIKTEKSRIEDLLRLAQLDYPVTGWIENDMSVSGDVDHPVVKGNFLAWDGSIKGELFQSISAGYDYDFQASNFLTAWLISMTAQLWSMA